MKNLTKWLYRGGRPNWVATILNGLWAAVHALGVDPNYLVTLEVRGRRSGRRISLSLVMVVIESERHSIDCLAGGCPMMYCEPVDFGHRCIRWILKMQSRLPD